MSVLQVGMSVLTERVVGGANMYVAPAITGLVDLLDRQVSDRPEGQALVLTRDRIPLSYGALAALVDDMAARLRSTGLRRGDAVGLISANNVEFVVALLGAARAGLVVAPLDPTLPQSEMAARLERLGAQGILVGPRAVDSAPPAQFPIPTWEAPGTTSPPAGSRRSTLEIGAGLVRHVRGAVDDLSDDDALVLFTSGTTDQAKMVPLTHANVAASVRAICAELRAGTRRCDGRGHAALPWSRVARGAAVLPGQRRMRAAA